MSNKFLNGLNITGNVTFTTDAAHDIGASGATRPRDLFLSRNFAAGGTATITGTTTAPVYDKGGQVANVVAYGADNTGASDTTAALNSALAGLPAGGGTIYVPPGTYQIASVWQPSKDNVVLQGAGIGATVFKRGAAYTGILFQPLADAMTFRDFSIDGNGAVNTSANTNEVQMSSAAPDGRWERVEFRNYRRIGIGIVCQRTTVSKCRFVGMASATIPSMGIWADHSLADTLLVENSVFMDNGINGIYSGIPNVTIRGCFFKNNHLQTSPVGGGQVDIQTDNALTVYNVSIVDNVFEASGGNDAVGIEVNNGTVLIQGNVLSGQKGGGISIQNSTTRAVIAGNVVRNSGVSGNPQPGIHLRSDLAGTFSAIITGNRCFDTQGTKTQSYGLRIARTDLTDYIVGGNDFRDNLTGEVSDLSSGSARQVFGNLPATLDSVFTSPLVAPVRDKAGQVLNVKAYGALGDGTTDDTAAIQSAIAALQTRGGVVYFPPGRYLTTKPIRIQPTSATQYQSITLRGAGFSANAGGSLGDTVNAEWAPASEIYFDPNGTPEAIIRISGDPRRTPNLVLGAGGGLAVTTYYYRVVALDAAGNQIGMTAEASIATDASNKTVNLSNYAMPNAASYRIHRGTTSGTPSAYYNTAATTFADSNSGVTAGNTLSLFHAVGGIRIESLGLNGNGRATVGIQADRLQYSVIRDVGVSNLAPYGKWVHGTANESPGIADPTTAPTLAATGSGSNFGPGTYRVRYSWNGTTSGETLPCTAATVVLTAGQQIQVTAGQNHPSSGTFNIYISDAGGAAGSEWLHAAGVTLSTTVPYVVTAIPQKGIGLHLHCTSSAADDCRDNVIDNLTCAVAPIGVLMSGNPAHTANAAHNMFRRIFLSYTRVGIVVEDADNNTFYDVFIYRQTYVTDAALAYAVDLQGYARANYFYHLEAGGNSGAGGVIARAPLSDATQGNTIFGYDRENGQPAPTLESGANLTWTEDGRNGSNGWNISSTLKVRSQFCQPANARLSGNVDNLTTNAAAVTGLSFAIGANEVWTFEFNLRVGSSSAAGMKVGLDIPAGATVMARVDATTSGPTAWVGELLTADCPSGGTAGLNATAFQTVNGQNGVCTVSGTVVNSSTAGTVQLMQAKVTSGTATVAANSYMVARRIS